MSFHEIELHWDEPNPANGELKPYEVFCIDNEGNPTIPIRTVQLMVIISNLKRNTEYKCTVKASTYNLRKQNPMDCEVFVDSHPIKTLDVGESTCLEQSLCSLYR